MRVGIVGGGIAGLVTARLLSRRHDVTVFEAGGHAGGHTQTVDVELDGERHAIDTGFIVFNHKTYPNFTRLLDGLRVPTAETAMSFSVHCDRTGLEYNGTSINTLYAQRRNLLSPSFHGMVREILRFNRDGTGQAAQMGGATVGAFLEAHGYGARFRDHYLVPMGASVWSCPPRAFLDFPVRFVMDFFGNHGMLHVHDRPVWRVIRGGSARYVEALTAPFADRIRLRAPVHAIRRSPHSVCVRTEGRVEAFDEVVIAAHSDQALAMLEDPSPVERRLLGAFPYQTNTAVLHTDTCALPRRRLAWAAWNYRIPATPASDVMVTYNMNILQRLQSRHVFCVSLNPSASIAPTTVLRRFTYQHPLYTTARDEAQREHPRVIRRNRTSFCGAYWGYGFHEDGVNSALAVGRAFGEEL
jgi:predicted NAD/FAD-binding protein